MITTAFSITFHHAQMPRLSFEKESGNLSWALSNMGLADIFKAGYAQLYDVSDYKWLSVSDIIHKTYLDIKEPSISPPVVPISISTAPQFDHHQSTSPIAKPIHNLFYNQHNTNPFSQHHVHAHKQYMQSPAQPAPQVLTQPLTPPTVSDIIEVTFDKPFVYFVMDNISGLVLVMGKVGREPATYRLPV